MGSEAILDFAKLQAASPPAEDPSSDGAADSAYWNVYNLRELAVRMEKETAAASDGEPDRSSLPKWRDTQDAACRALEAGCWHFKMLGWLIEALVRTRGYAGLRDGFRLSREMIQQHWAELYPALSDGPSDRIAPLAGLNGEDREGPLPGLVRRVPLIPESAGGYALLHYLKARDIEAVADPDTRARMESQPGAVSMQQLTQAAAQTPREFVDELLGDLADCQQEFDALWSVLEEHCHPETPGYPPSSHVRNALGEVRETLEQLFPYVHRRAEAPNEAAGTNSATQKDGNGSTDATFGGREKAFQQMLEMAGFFRRTEPHSPVPYLLDLAVRWGRKPLHNLLMDAAAHELLTKLVEAQQPSPTEQN